MLPHHAVSADDKTFKVHPFNHVSSKHPVPHGVLTIPITASWVPSSSSARPEHGILVPETFNYKTMLPSSTSDLTSFGLVRSASNQGRMYYIFYAVDDVTMWALPCNQKGVTWARLSKRMMPAIPNLPQLDAAAVSLVQRVVVQRQLEYEARHNEQKRRQTEAKRAAAAAEMHKERIKQRKVFCATHAAEVSGAGQQQPRTVDAARLDPEQDPDACLALYNELNGHGIVWNAENPPPSGCSEEVFDAWVEKVKEDIENHVSSPVVDMAEALAKVCTHSEPPDLRVVRCAGPGALGGCTVTVGVHTCSWGW